jgi:hypothetical protein
LAADDLRQLPEEKDAGSGAKGQQRSWQPAPQAATFVLRPRSVSLVHLVTHPIDLFPSSSTFPSLHYSSSRGSGIETKSPHLLILILLGFPIVNPLSATFRPAHGSPCFLPSNRRSQSLAYCRPCTSPFSPRNNYSRPRDRLVRIRLRPVHHSQHDAPCQRLVIWRGPYPNCPCPSHHLGPPFAHRDFQSVRPRTLIAHYNGNTYESTPLRSWAFQKERGNICIESASLFRVSADAPPSIKITSSSCSCL